MEVSYTQTTEQGDVQVKAKFRKATGRDGFLRELITDRLKTITGKEDRDGAFWLFGRAVSQLILSEGLPFAIPDENTGDDELQTSFERWWGMDEEFIDQCFNALESLRKPANKATGPVPPPPDAPKN